MNNALQPVDFKEANLDLSPFHKYGNQKGIRVYAGNERCISCWKLTILQRLSVLIFGRIWLGMDCYRWMPNTWLACGKTCFITEKNARRREAAGNRGAVAFAAIAIVSLIVSIGLAVYMLTNPPPMTGHISGKNYHPASYPVSADTPMVYVLTITGEDGKQGCSWVVDADTYDSYAVGDNVKRGVHGNDNDTAAAPGQGAG